MANRINDLPHELLKVILHRAAEFDDRVDAVEGDLMLENHWVYMAYGAWLVRTHQESANKAERNACKNKKSIALVCQLWNQLGIELLYHSLLLEKPEQLGTVLDVIREKQELGWWTQRITIHPLLPSKMPVSPAVTQALIELCNLCVNVTTVRLNVWQSDIIEDGITVRFIRSLPRSLLHLRIFLPADSVPLFGPVIITFQSLEHLEIELEDALPSEMGDAGFRLTPVTMPNLRTLNLRGHMLDLLLCIAKWTMPKLTSLTFSFLSSLASQRVASGIVRAHAAQLKVLDLNSISPWDVSTTLDESVNLEKFAFNPDWPLAHIVKTPHMKIVDIGLHELWYASEVSQGAIFSTVHPIRAAAIRGSNDRNITRLTRESFPQLKRVRVLNRKLLQDLYRANGPPERSMPLWQGWMMHADREGFRLEDCTGNMLGVLPDSPSGGPVQYEQWESDEGSEDAEYEEDGYGAGEYDDESSEPPPESEDDGDYDLD